MCRIVILLSVLLLTSSFCSAENCTSLEGLELRVRPEVLDCSEGKPIELDLEIFNSSDSEVRFEVMTHIHNNHRFFKTTDPSIGFTAWDAWSDVSKPVVLRPQESKVFERVELYERYHWPKERKFKIGFQPICNFKQSAEVVWSEDLKLKAKNKCSWCPLHSELGNPSEQRCIESLRFQLFRSLQLQGRLEARVTAHNK